MVKGGLTIVSNRLPVTITDQSGGITVERSIGGLATALGSVVGRGHAKWVGWTGLEHSLPPAELRRAGLSENLIPIQPPAKLLRGFYHNFSNRVLWPLMHGMQSVYRPSEKDWESYKEANRRYADAALAAAGPDGIFWAHDYHLLLLPRYLREKGASNRAGLFLHIPFPEPGDWFLLPQAREILENLNQADVLGFQSAHDAENFRECARRIGISEPSCRVGVFPIGVDFEAYNAAPKKPDVKKAVERIRGGALKGKKVIFSLSRLDYTKGLLTQLRAVERFLANHARPEKFVYKLVVAPSREKIDEYRHLKEDLVRLAADINRRLGSKKWQPVDYSYQNIGFRDVTAWYATSEVLLVLPDIDGMNLVTKEYVATRQDDEGMLVISNTIGAAA